MMILRFFSLLAVVFIMAGCSRYDYHPRGVHYEEKKDAYAQTTSYIVKKGDTLYSIGRRFSLDFHKLAIRNAIRRPYTIYVGQRLFITRNMKSSGKSNHTAAKPYKPKQVAVVKKPKPYKPPVAKHPVASKGKVKLRWPARGRLSSRFGPRKGRMHDGLDIANKEGTAVYAAASGLVVHSNAKLSGYGNLIIIRHSSDMFTAYAHNQKNLVRKGDRVKAGQRIAAMGSTGRATGSHLHFEIRRGETAVDPLAYLPKR